MKSRSLFLSFSRYVSLNVAGMLALSCYILADTFFIAHRLGPNGLTALNLAIPVYSLIHGTGLMIGMGGGTLFSIRRSSGDAAGSSCAFTCALRLGARAALLFLLTGIFAGDMLTGLLGADASVYAITRIYLKILLCFAPAFLLNNIMLCFIRNDGEPALSMAAMVTGSLSNIVLDYIFMYPFGLGMAGAAVATGLAPLISLCVLSLHVLRRRSSLSLCKTPFFNRYYGRILSLGLSSLITETASGIVIIAFNLIILSLSGNTGVAAYGIIANLSLVVTSIFTGIAQGLQPLVSYAHGSGNSCEIRTLRRMALISSEATAVTIYLLLYLFHSEIIHIFTSDNSLYAIAKPGIFLYFTGFLFAGANLINAALYSATNHPVPAFIISISRGFIILLPCVFVLSRFLGMTGVWLAFPVTELLTLGTGNFQKFPVPNVSK